MVEHLTADQEVPGSNPGAPSQAWSFLFFLPLFLSPAVLLLKFPYRIKGKCPSTLQTSFAGDQGGDPGPAKPHPQPLGGCTKAHSPDGVEA